jgi:nicotinamide-nucleotide amidase
VSAENFNTAAIDKARNYFIKNKKTVAVAESVTAGNIQAALSLAKDASLFFQGGITVYNLGQKCRHLGIEPIHAASCNCVSEIVSKQMAEKICRLFIADFGIGITGFASLVPEEKINSLYAIISISKNGKAIITQKVTAKKDLTPQDVQVLYTNEAIKLLNQALHI